MASCRFRRYDEVAAGAIHHAIRDTMPSTLFDASGGHFVPPATHASGTSSTAKQVTGLRLRLKSSFDISGFSPTNQIILTARKEYGLILADNGGAFYFQGTPDARWDNEDLNALDAVASSNFEVVASPRRIPATTTRASHLQRAADRFVHGVGVVGRHGHERHPRLEHEQRRYDVIDVVGSVRGTSTTVTPTYALNVTNAYGRAMRSVTVTVK